MGEVDLVGKLEVWMAALRVSGDRGMCWFNKPRRGNGHGAAKLELGASGENLGGRGGGEAMYI